VISTLTVRDLNIEVNRKEIKNLHLSVLPPDGRVRVSAPAYMTEQAVRLAVISKLGWIKRQQQAFDQQPRQSSREMVSGESHYLWGQRYLLEVEQKQARHVVKLRRNNRLQLCVTAGTSADNRLKVLEAYYRTELTARITPLIEHWQTRVGVQANDWRIKKMKTKWGSCNIASKRIWLNLELAKKPPQCLEYILVHELIHLRERHHNERFKALMTQFMPDWQARRDLLNSLPLAYEDWQY